MTLLVPALSVARFAVTNTVVVVSSLTMAPEALRWKIRTLSPARMFGVTVSQQPPPGSRTSREPGAPRASRR
jgi:hypothetical protein